MTDLLTPAQVAAKLGISVKVLRAHVRAGEIDYIATGRGSTRQHRMFHPADLESFIEARRKRECRSTSQKADRTISTTSGFKVYDFTVPRSAPRNAMLNSTSASASKRRPPSAKQPSPPVKGR